MAVKQNDFICNGVYRMKTEHRFDFPVQVRSAGFNRFLPGGYELPEKKNFLELFWCSSGKFQFPSGVLTPDSVCCFFPGDLHDIHLLEPGVYYWITFDGDTLESLIESIHLMREPHEAGSCPIHLFRQVMEYLCCTGAYNEWQAGCTGYEILTRSAVAFQSQESSYAARFCQLVARHFSEPEFSIDSAAEKLHIHRSTLTRQMIKEYGMSPQQYLMSCRMQQAEAYLQNTALFIKEIAIQTGFPDPNYFCRIFQRKNGLSPQKFRETTRYGLKK